MALTEGRSIPGPLAGEAVDLGRAYVPRRSLCSHGLRQAVGTLLDFKLAGCVAGHASIQSIPTLQDPLWRLQSRFPSRCDALAGRVKRLDGIPRCGSVSSPVNLATIEALAPRATLHVPTRPLGARCSDFAVVYNKGGAIRIVWSIVVAALPGRRQARRGG
jgi:hypothetical protein